MAPYLSLLLISLSFVIALVSSCFLFLRSFCSFLLLTLKKSLLLSFSSLLPSFYHLHSHLLFLSSSPSLFSSLLLPPSFFHLSSSSHLISSVWATCRWRAFSKQARAATTTNAPWFSSAKVAGCQHQSPLLQRLLLP